METQQILEALDTDEKVVKLAIALHKNGATFSIILNGKPVIMQPQGEKCLPGYVYNPEINWCVLDVG